MKVSRYTLYALFLMLLLLLLVACGGENDQGTTGDANTVTEVNGEGEEGSEKAGGKNLSIANITGPQNSWSLNIEKIAEVVEEKSNGEITVDLYPSGQLGNEEEMIQQLTSGSLDMAAITMAELSSASPTFNAWMLPFLIDDHDQAYELMTSQEALDLFNHLGSNLKGLGYVYGGFRNMVSTKDVQSIDDIRGLNIRTTPSPLIQDFWTSLDASPVQMPLTEVFSAMQTGVIDALETDTESLVTENLMEQAKYLIRFDHMYWVGGLLINEDYWNELSEEHQQILEEAIEIAMEYNLDIVKDREAEFEQVATEEYSLTVSTFDSKTELTNMVEDFRNKWEADASDEFEAFVKKAAEITGKSGD